MKKFNDRKQLENIIGLAYDKAKSLSSKYIHLEYVLYAVLKNIKFIKLFKQYKINYENLLNEVEDFISNFPLIEHLESSSDKIEISKHVKVFLGYYEICKKCNEDICMKDDILFITNVLSAFLFMEDTFAQKLLLKNKVNHEFITKIYQKNSNDEIKSRISNKINEFENENISSREKEYLNAYTINLTEKVSDKNWFPIIGRINELELLQQILLRHNKPNVIITGNTGVGKTKIIEGLVKIYSEKYPNKIFYQLDTLSFMSNIMVKGELENRVKNLSQIIKKKGNVILVIEDIHTLCTGGDYSGQLDVAGLLKPLLNDGLLKIIGTTTIEEYRKSIEKDTPFAKNFFKLNIEEPSIKETKEILMNIKYKYENIFNVKYSEKIVDLIIESCEKYFSNKSFPDKAIDIIDMLGAYAQYNNEKEITENMVYKTLSTLLNIPLSNISQSEEDLYQHLEENIKKEIIGQDEAVKQVSDAVIISRSGLRETNKTVTSLMFKGSSGVGKTEICKVLSKIMNIPLIRFDMSEYMEDHSVSKLIGAPPGYKGFSDGKSGNGLLINAIDEHPNCILLLDEIEKANTKIHNILLQVMDNGKLTSSSGKSVSFEHVFLIMTSNVGSYNSHKIRIGFGNNDTSPSDQDYEDRFLPEFRSRIDSTVTFNNLSKNILKNICIKFLNELKEILIKKNVDFVYNDDIIDYIVDKTIHLNNGARPMKHIITNEIKNVIAKDIVFGKYKNGGNVKLSIKDNKINFGE